MIDVKQKIKKRLKGISLFTGAGGMDVGFAGAGIDIILANELNDLAVETYLANHPQIPVLKGDVNTYFEEFKKYEGNVDIIFGGPPCQGFSVAGKMDPNDERSKLIWSFLKVVEIIKPELFIMENVKALATLDKWKKTKECFLQKTKELGYFCTPIVLNAADFGVCQKRERVFFVAFKYDLNASFNKNLIELKKTALPLREVLSALPRFGTSGNPSTCNAKITLAANPVLRKSPYAGMLFNGMGRPLNLNSVSQTLPASMGGNKTPIIDENLLKNKDCSDWINSYHRKLINKEITPEYKTAPDFLRRITIKEAAKIQTFPDDYIFIGSKTAIYTQIGNAVPCELAKSVATAAIKTLLDSKELTRIKN